MADPQVTGFNSEMVIHDFDDARENSIVLGNLQMINESLVGGFKHLDYFPFHMGSSFPLTFIFFRGRSTTNQFI